MNDLRSMLEKNGIIEQLMKNTVENNTFEIQKEKQETNRNKKKMVSAGIQVVRDLLKTYRIGIISTASVLTVAFLAKKFYFAGGVCKSKRKLNGKTVIITGANTGIGRN